MDVVAIGVGALGAVQKPIKRVVNVGYWKERNKASAMTAVLRSPQILRKVSDL